MPSLNDLSLPDLFAHLSRTGLVRRALELARDEDLGAAGFARHGLLADITTRAVAAADEPAAATIMLRPGQEGAVLSGLACVPQCLEVFSAALEFAPLARDGDRFTGAPAAVARLSGPLAHVLVVERTILNLLGRLSGVATRTARFVAELSGTPAALLDTRKTTPGLRVLEKYAVRCGGGLCHRLGLHDAVLVKDNHLAHVRPGELAAFLSAASARARACDPAPDSIEVEVDSLDQLSELLAAGGCGADMVLLDNFSPDQLRRAVELRDRFAVPLLLEASGGVALGTIRQVALTGVDRISAGSLTHGATWVDFGLDLPG
ncbi:MAG TPA: carboxylating nicotinate-nucleotide diphosphorylase [Phycisphaerales bacterium]|nr:carboxylating nicotinate-nucleotide diphosphorylase [Phycisphaerales bacterium]